MIVDYKQNKNSVDLSYIDNTGYIKLQSIPIYDGFYKYVECDDSDPSKIPNFKSFHGSSIKKEKYYRFQGMNINEFFNIDLKNILKEDSEKLFALNQPSPYSVDIETDITDEHGYSNEIDVENRVLSISVTNGNFTTILFRLKSETLSRDINVIERGYIDNILRENTKQYFDEYNLGNYQIKNFDTEYEMLQTFFECVNKYFHFIFGWNFFQYDMRYLVNRAKKIGLNIKTCSPTGETYDKEIRINDRTSINVTFPTHRMVADYMMLFKASHTYRTLGSFKLESISQEILQLGKVSYDGNLRTLYNEDQLKYIAYSLMDTILGMLLHKKTNLIGTDLFQSHYTNIPYTKLSQNAVSEALVYKELRKDNLFLLESEYTKLEHTYPGAFVKNPITKIVESLLGLDFRALYPMSMITGGLSPDALVDFIYTNEAGYPKTQKDMDKWLQYKNMGFALTPRGRIYDVTKDYLYTRILKGLINEREHYETIRDDIYLNIIPSIEKEISMRETKQI